MAKKTAPVNPLLYQQGNPTPTELAYLENWLGRQGEHVGLDLAVKLKPQGDATTKFTASIEIGTTYEIGPFKTAYEMLDGVRAMLSDAAGNFKAIIFASHNTSPLTDDAYFAARYQDQVERMTYKPKPGEDLDAALYGVVSYDGSVLFTSHFLRPCALYVACRDRGEWFVFGKAEGGLVDVKGPSEFPELEFDDCRGWTEDETEPRQMTVEPSDLLAMVARMSASLTNAGLL